MPSRGSAAADERLPRVHRNLDGSARVTRDTLAASGGAIAVRHVPCELVESARFPETAAT